MPNAPRPSAAAQKRELAEIDKDLLDCTTLVAVDRCANHWTEVARKDGWSPDYKQAAAAKFAARREALQKEAA